MALLRTPTEQSVNYLSDLSDSTSIPQNLRNAAILALGSTAGTGLKLASEQGAEKYVFEDAISHLESSYLDSSNAADKNMYLLGLGNAGSDTSATILLDLAQSQNPNDRANAIDSLRFVNSPEVDSRVAQIITSDTNIDVQLKAIQSTVYREPNADLDQVLLAVGEASASDEVRAAAYAALEFRAGGTSEVLSAFESASKADASADVRAYTSEVLAARTQSDGVGKAGSIGEMENLDAQSIGAAPDHIQDTRYTAAFETLTLSRPDLDEQALLQESLIKPSEPSL
jgi:hypothetical protein